MWASTLLSPYLHPKLRSLVTELYKSPLVNTRCALVYIPSLVGGAYVWAYCITEGVTKQCTARLRLTIETTSNILAGYYVTAECIKDVEKFAQKIQ